MGKVLILATACAAVLAPAGAMAQSTGIGLGPSVGTDGLGADVYFKAHPLLMLRGGFRYADVTISREVDDIDYDFDVGFTSGVTAIDIHPMANGFQISAGVYIGDRNVGMLATPTVPVEIGSQTFTPQEVGVITGDAEWNTVAPFIGIGYNNGAYALKRFGFRAMLGAMYIGDPAVALAATGGILEDDANFLIELAAEEDRLADDLDDIQFYPVLNLGLTVRF